MGNNFNNFQGKLGKFPFPSPLNNKKEVVNGKLYTLPFKRAK